MAPQENLQLLDVRIDNIRREQAMQIAQKFLQTPVFHQVVTPGPEFLLEASANPRFRKILNRADLSLPDGFGLHLAARLTGQKLAGRVTGVDFANDLMVLSAKHGYRVFLFGGRPGVADRAAQRLLRTHPGLSIVGIESGQRGPWKKLHDQRIAERIRASHADILMVGLGAPKQEYWIDDHRHVLGQVRLAVGVGRTFDYFSGDIRRAPAFVRRSGFEWLDTYVRAGRFHDPHHRRQRVRNAVWHFLVAAYRHHHA